MINIYKVPGVFIVGFHGPFGVGKTLGLVEQGIIMANKFNLKLVSSFPINQYWLNRYCDHKKYNRINWKIIDLDNLEEEMTTCNRFSKEFIDNYDRERLTPILYLFSQQKSVILLDEAGLKLFSRNFKDMDNRIFNQMFQLRKNRSFLFYSCQYLGQIDKQLRDNTHLWIYCKGMQEFSKKKQQHILISRDVIAFSREQFEMFMKNPEKQNKMIYPLMLSGWRFSHNNLMFNKFFGLLNHIKKALKQAHEESKGTGLYKLFWEIHYLEKYFSKLDFLSDEDLLFKVYDSFGKIGDTKNKKKEIKIINSTLTREIKECPDCEYKGDKFTNKIVKTEKRQTFETTCLKCGYFWKEEIETEEIETKEVETKKTTKKNSFEESLDKFLSNEEPTNGKVNESIKLW